MPVRFQAVGSAPILRQKVFKVSASQKFETVVNFLRKKLDCKPTDSVFLYVNSVFAPGLDEGVGNLYRVSDTSGHKDYGLAFQHLFSIDPTGLPHGSVSKPTTSS